MEQPERLRVLVVDDKIAAATSLAFALQVLSYRTATAFGPVSGLRVFELFRPAVVLVDLSSEEDGCSMVQLAKRLCADRDQLATFVFLANDETMGARALSSGFDYFVMKPILPHALAMILQRVDRPSSGC